MNTIRSFAFILLAIITLAGCQSAAFRKTPGGMPYKVFEGSGGKVIKAGYYVRANIITKVKDSVYFTTYGKLPMFIRVDEMTHPYDLSEVWTKVKSGDSIITTQLMDTFIKRAPGNVPPQFRNGDQITTYIKILDVYTNDSTARLAEEKSKQDKLTSEISEIAKYLAGRKITALKTPSGAYVQIIQPGTGDSVQRGKYISINYTGTSFSGKKFDSNTDSAFHHMEPYSFQVGGNPMIKGFDEALLMLRKGSVAKVFIPSMLGYGASPGTPLIQPFEHLTFDVEVLDVQDKAPAAPQQQPQQPGNQRPQPQGGNK